MKLASIVGVFLLVFSAASLTFAASPPVSRSSSDSWVAGPLIHSAMRGVTAAAHTANQGAKSSPQLVRVINHRIREQACQFRSAMHRAGSHVQEAAGQIMDKVGVLFAQFLRSVCSIFLALISVQLHY
jgi:hypothetical protein